MSAAKVIVVERGDATGAWYWKDSQTMCMKDRSMFAGIKSSKERLMVMCYGNASEIIN
jgi:hypothetical protein